MTKHQAKLLLQTCRPGGADARDPLCAEALAQVRLDPDLARWFEAEQQFDAAIGAKLRELPVPPNLKAEILAGSILLRSSPRWQYRAWLATAAALALLFAGAAMWFRAPDAPDFAALRDEMLRRAVSDPQHLAFSSRSLADIGEWIRRRGVAGDLNLPAGLRGLTPHGCRVLDWNHEKIALVCLVPEGQPHVDLLVIDRARFRNFTPPGMPQVGRSGELTTAVWTSGGKTYLLAGRMDPDQMRKLL
jgi:hypothetical protein